MCICVCVVCAVRSMNSVFMPRFPAFSLLVSTLIFIFSPLHFFLLPLLCFLPFFAFLLPLLSYYLLIFFFSPFFHLLSSFCLFFSLDLLFTQVVSIVVHFLSINLLFIFIFVQLFLPPSLSLSCYAYFAHFFTLLHFKIPVFKAFLIIFLSFL